MTADTFSHQPLGPNGRPIVIDRLSIAWYDHHGVERLRLYEEIIGLALHLRRRPWGGTSRNFAIRDARLVRLDEENRSEDAMRLLLRDELATLDVPLAPGIVTDAGRVVARVTLPHTLVTASTGRRLSEIVHLPSAFDAIVSHVEPGCDRLDIHLVNPFVLLPLDGMLEEQHQGRKAHGRRHANLRSVRRTRLRVHQDGPPMAAA